MRRRWAAASTALTGALFVAVFLLVHSVNGRPLRIDRWATNWAVTHRPDWTVHLARAITTLGTPVVVYPALMAAGIVAAFRLRRWWLLPSAPAVLFAAQTLRHAMSSAIERPRPPQQIRAAGSSGWAFPSGHTTLATAGFGLACGLLLMSLSTERPRRAATALVAAGTAILAVAVGLSRVELGVHWLTDVIGGWLLGGFAISVVILVIPSAPQHLSRDP